MKSLKSHDKRNIQSILNYSKIVMIEKDFDNVTKQKYLPYQFYFLRRVREIFFIPIKRCRKLNHELRSMWFRMKNRGKGFIFFLNLSLNWSKLKNVTIQRENNISDTQSKHHPNFVWHLLCSGGIDLCTIPSKVSIEI